MGTILAQEQATNDGLDKMVKLRGRAKTIFRVLRRGDEVHADNGYNGDTVPLPIEVDGTASTQTDRVTVRRYAIPSSETSWRPPYFPDLAEFPISLGPETPYEKCSLGKQLGKMLPAVWHGRNADWERHLFEMVGRRPPQEEAIGNAVCGSSCGKSFGFGNIHYCDNSRVILRYLTGFQGADENVKW